MTLWIKHIAALLALTSSFGGYRYYRYQFEQHNHQHADGTWHDNIGCVHEVTISLLASTDQKAWLEPALKAFNSSYRGRVHVAVSYAEDREALQDLLSGKLKPLLWSPGATLWAKRLNQAYTGTTAPGSPLIRWNDPHVARTYLQTSLVLLAHKETIRQAEVGDHLARFSHNNPVATSSGFFTMGVYLAQYRQTLSPEQHLLPLETLAKSEGFFLFLRKREHNLFYDEAGESGTLALTQSFAQEPKRYGAIWTWRSIASEVLQKSHNMTATEPQTPIIALQSVVLLNTPTVTEDQREATEKLLDFLAKPKAIDMGIAAGFEAIHKSTTETTDYAALNAATYQWRRLRIAPAL